jgi:uncharacterized protein YneF (UPF0154 family)
MKVFLLFITLLIIFWISGHFWELKQSKQALMDWARINEYRIIQKRFAFLHQGAFSGRACRNYLVYWILIIDRSGIVRQGWVRCELGGFFFADRVEVIWER